MRRDGTRAGPFRDLAHNLPRRGRKRGWPATVPPVEVQSAGLVVASRIAPTMNRDTAFFWDGLREHKLLFQRCKDCNTVRHPPGPMCPILQLASVGHDRIVGPRRITEQLRHAEVSAPAHDGVPLHRGAGCNSKRGCGWCPTSKAWSLRTSRWAPLSRSSTRPLTTTPAVLHQFRPAT